MSEPFLEALLPKLGFIVMERADSGELVLVTPAPRWFVDAATTAAAGGPATLGGTLPFLDHVRIEADRFWWSGEEGVLSCEPFAVTGAAEEHLVRPRVATVKGRKFLLLERLTGSADSRPVLQAAREAQLEHERTLLRAGDVRAPIDVVTELAAQLLAAGLPPAAHDTARSLVDAAARARTALDVLTEPRG